MIATFTIGSVLFEISGTPEECRQFIGYAKTGNLRWWETPAVSKVCNPFAAHYGTCGAEDCPIGTDGKMKKRKGYCTRCRNTSIEHTKDFVTWEPGGSFNSRAERNCPVCK